MSLPKINLVVIGHKDHGKSTLIGRLLYDSNAIPKQKLQEIEEESKRLGKKEFKFHFLLDSLEEERKGGLTIDIMQTPFKTKKYLYTIIDCPGHKEFVKNMITGASQADAAILVVSAKEGIQDQTKQHIFLTKTLGINQLVVAVNKMDEVNYNEERFKEVSEKLKKVLISLGYEKVPIVPVSALNGDNLLKRSKKFQWYDGPTLFETLDKTISPSTSPISKPLRACVQDVYKLKEEKIVVCKIETGNLESGRRIVFEPSGEKGLVKKIEMFGKEIRQAKPGDSVGLIVSGIKEVNRGDVVSYPENPAKLVNSFIAEIILFSDAKIRNDDVQTIRCGTAEKKCKVLRILEKIDPINLTSQETFPAVLQEGDVGKVMFSAIEPICLEEYSEIPQLGRFIIEGKRGAMAAGIVLEVKRS
ncbi:MAG: GTP-binding protein [Candidatus Bathyarchaeia archaeon]